MTDWHGPVVLSLFCLSYPSIKLQNRFHPQQCLVCQGMTLMERVRGRFWKNVVNKRSDTLILCLLETILG